MTREEVLKEIKAELGAPTVKVELDEANWDKIFARALRWFRAKKGLIKCQVINIVDGQVEYDYPVDAYDIVDVVLPEADSIQSIVSLGFFDIVNMNNMRLGSANSAFNSYSSYVQMLQALETRKRIFNTEQSWHLSCGKIYLTSRSCSTGGSGQAIVFYKTKNVDIPDLIGGDEDLIYRYCLAECKYRLGRVRGKYKSYPAAGGSVDTDADDLINEYKEEIEILEEEISESQGAMGFTTG